MECSQVRAILFENADTQIPMELREDVEAHLAACRSCAIQFEALKEQSNALGNLPKVEAPRDFLEQVRSRVEKPSLLSMLKQRLPVLFAGGHFFKLAGAAATAVLVIAASQVLLREGGQKAPLSRAPASVESPPSIGLPLSVEAPQAVPAPPGPVESPASVGPPPAQRSVEAPARPESLPGIPKKEGKSFSRAASPAAEPHRFADVGTQSVALTVKPPRSSARGKTRGSSKPESFSASSPSAAGMRTQGDRSRQDASTIGGGAAQKFEGGRPSTQKISSDVIRLIERANGKVLSAGPARDENQPETLLAEIPAGNYPSFLDQLRQLGEVESKGNEELNLAPDAKIRVSVRFEF